MRTLLIAAVVVVGLSVPLVAQDQNWIAGSCKTCVVVSYVDVPGWSGLERPPARVSKDGFWIKGWGFLCEQGLPITRVQVWYQKDDGFWDILPNGQLSGHGIERWDVYHAYRQYCTGLSTNAGWHLWLTHTPPVGTRNIAIKVWHGPYVQSHYRTVTIH